MPRSAVRAGCCAAVAWRSTCRATSLLAGRFDFTQTLRIVVNLLDNAAKYSPAGSPIDLRARQQDDRLVIDVMDRGPGVPERERDRIFEPFYRPPGVPPDIRGYGLGLSIARGLAEAQGGSVRYAAATGRRIGVHPRASSDSNRQRLGRAPHGRRRRGLSPADPDFRTGIPVLTARKVGHILNRRWRSMGGVA